MTSGNTLEEIDSVTHPTVKVKVFLCNSLVGKSVFLSITSDVHFVLSVLQFTLDVV